VPAVSQEVSEPADDALIAHSFGCLRDAAGTKTRLPHGLASAQGILLGHFQMETEFLVCRVTLATECSQQSPVTILLE
jgi:hypothetical protein